MSSSNTNNSFEKIISDAYEKGEFDPPFVKHIGEITDLRDMEQPSGSDIVHRKFGETALHEAYRPDGMRMTSLNNGEVSMVEQPDQSRVTTREGDDAFEVTTPTGDVHRIGADDTPVSLDVELPETKKTTEERQDGDDSGQN